MIRNGVPCKRWSSKQQPARYLSLYSIMSTPRNLAVPFNIASVIVGQLAGRIPYKARNLPSASLHFSSGYFSTMHLMFSSSVKAMASSESMVWPLGQEYTESP